MKIRNSFFLELTDVLYFPDGDVVFIDWQVFCPFGVRFEDVLRSLNCLYFVTVDECGFCLFLRSIRKYAGKHFSSIDFL